MTAIARRIEAFSITLSNQNCTVYAKNFIAE